DVLQDASNILQKASAKGALNNASRLNPYYTTKKPEQYNQIPVMVAVLKNTKIIGKDKTESNVWDEITINTKTDTIVLNDNFATPANIKSWVDKNGEDYYDFKSVIRDVIKNVHGDYDPTSGIDRKSTRLNSSH